MNKSTRSLAACAVMTALLIAVQFILSYVPGVELVSVFFICFCYVYGVYYGALTATAFSLIRCFIYGAAPNVIVLYLIYYNFVAVVFGILGRRSLPKWVSPMLLCAIAAMCAYFAVKGIPISILYQRRISIMLWVLFGIIVSLLACDVILLFKFRDSKGVEIASVTSVAAFCTILFTLLDDVITPLFMGYSTDTAIAYAYTGFLAMIPQTICVSISVFLLFYPLKIVFQRSVS